MKKIAVKIEGISATKRFDLRGWEWGDLDNCTLAGAARRGAEVVLDEMRNWAREARDGEPGCGLLFHWPELTIWPIGGDNPLMTFDIEKIAVAWIDDDLGESDADEIDALRKSLARLMARCDAWLATWPAK
jgi:hypothetical protein